MRDAVEGGAACPPTMNPQRACPRGMQGRSGDRAGVSRFKDSSQTTPLRRPQSVCGGGGLSPVLQIVGGCGGLFLDAQQSPAWPFLLSSLTLLDPPGVSSRSRVLGNDFCVFRRPRKACGQEGSGAHTLTSPCDAVVGCVAIHLPLWLAPVFYM